MLERGRRWLEGIVQERFKTGERKGIFVFEKACKHLFIIVCLILSQRKCLGTIIAILILLSLSLLCHNPCKRMALVDVNADRQMVEVFTG